MADDWVVATAEARRKHLAAMYREEAARLTRAALAMERATARSLARRETPVPFVGGPRFRKYEDALDAAVMAL